MALHAPETSIWKNAIQNKLPVDSSLVLSPNSTKTRLVFQKLLVEIQVLPEFNIYKWE